MALSPDANIYKGFWTDWSRGKIWGLTWTLHPTEAVIFTNCMALFVTLFGAQLWTIVRYTLHQMSSPNEPNISTPHLNKQQVILRNASSGVSTARLMLKLAWKSRRSTGKRSKRAWSIGLIAILYAVLVMVIELFSSKAIGVSQINGGDPVLSRSRHCGIWNDTYYGIVVDQSYTTEKELGLSVQYYANVASEVQLSYEYAQECYMSTPVNNQKSSTCSTMKKAKIPWQAAEGPCPFAENLCQSDSKALVLDTGYIDSYNDLGINAEPKDRLKYRRITSCAVVNGTGRVIGWDGQTSNSNDDPDSREFAYARFGPSTYKNTDYTYSLSNFASFYDNFTVQVTNPYQLNVQRAMGLADPQWSPSDFDPIPELAQVGDLTLLFLSFNGMYLGQVDDPWFSAHGEHSFNTSLPFLNQRYTRDAAISTLGCTEQHQFCNEEDRCTGLLGFDQVQNDNFFNTGLSPQQNATFDRMLRAVVASTLRNSVEYLALTTTPILASKSIASGRSGAVVSRALPDDQWKTELQYWHSVSMSHLQRTMVQWVTGQIAPEPEYLQAPIAEQDIWFCKSLIIPSAVYSSFSVMSIIIIFVFGIFVIIASLNVEKLARWIRKLLRKQKSKNTWNDDHMLGIKAHRNKSPKTTISEKDYEHLHPMAQQRGSEIFEWEKIPPLPEKQEDKIRPREEKAFPSFKDRLSPSHAWSPDNAPPRPRRDSKVSLLFKECEITAPEMPKKAMSGSKEKRYSRLYLRPSLSPRRAKAPSHLDGQQDIWI
ncbi:hypothetical protein LTR84_004132 [Exophiala bonariae]|uniref:Uncharacterized protein n=1 Tax=Exophiala bonariae TaxID=1690606 RepID=A0AAV9N6K1_9EURO|nr:hypothetical protein LTR84_004132 [Exophiala bonariae]